MLKLIRALLTSILFNICSVLSAQEITIHAESIPLNQVLENLVRSYSVNISFDDQSLSQYKITFSGKFSSAEPAIKELIRGLPLEYEKNGEVFVIFPAAVPEKERSYTLRAQVIEQDTGEPLPYSTIRINGYGMASDLKGSFAYISSTDSVFDITISHLGYYILDTTVTAQPDLKFPLTPSVIGLTEVEIINSRVEKSLMAGEKAGMTKLNHQIANFLPGFGDNSVFNLLRLQPGILASGEQTNELIIWGCYEGQSKVIFDGFTIYSLKNFNDNISSFNPLMAKDIEVYKGGYDARFGERVGGIVNVTGKTGNNEKTSFSVNINNMTLNGMVEVPVSRRSSLIVALRHTYYELYNPGTISSRAGNGPGKDSANYVDVNIVPDYRFRDINIKYSASFRESDLFYVSLYGSKDNFSYSIEEPVRNVLITKNTGEKNIQTGGSVFYGRSWKNGYLTNFRFSNSRLRSDFSDDLTVERVLQQQTNHVKNLDALNMVRENTLQADNRFTFKEANILEAGLVFISNKIELKEDTFDIIQANIKEEARRMTLFLQDRMTVGKIMDITAGFRLTHAYNLKRLYFEPRISVSVKTGKYTKFNAAWGLYDQFITKSSVLDELGNYRYTWIVCDNEEIPVVKGMHFVAGASYNRNEFTFSFEGYYKTTDGLTRYIRNSGLNLEGIYQGTGRGYGMDILIKKDYQGHSAWVSYSLSKTEELFEYFKKAEYKRAPQDQRHEVKAAILLNFDPFFTSADYVFGSGFPASTSILDGDEDDLIYSRLDVAFIYKFLDRKLKGEIGISVLNVLNTQNIKYSNFERIPATQTNSVNIYSEAIPITPALYFKLSL